MKRFALLLILSMPGMQAFACGCDKPKTPADVASRSPDYIFEGNVESVISETHTWGKSQLVTFMVTKLHQGAPIERISVIFSQGGSSCDLEPPNFTTGNSFLISASGPHSAAERSEVKVPHASASLPYLSNYCDLRESIEWRPN